jgi:hypothetical protein
MQAPKSGILKEQRCDRFVPIIRKKYIEKEKLVSKSRKCGKTKSVRLGANKMRETGLEPANASATGLDSSSTAKKFAFRNGRLQDGVFFLKDECIRILRQYLTIRQDSEIWE